MLVQEILRSNHLSQSTERSLLSKDKKMNKSRHLQCSLLRTIIETGMTRDQREPIRDT